MKNYIDEEEFLKQKYRCQKTLKDWFERNVKIGDLIFDDNQLRPVEDFNTHVICGNDILSFYSITPAFRIDQLIGYIESKILSYSKLEIEWCNEGYKINIVSSINDEKVFCEYETFKSDMIEALWYVVCKIAEEW